MQTMLHPKFDTYISIYMNLPCVIFLTYSYKMVIRYSYGSNGSCRCSFTQLKHIQQWQNAGFYHPKFHAPSSNQTWQWKRHYLYLSIGDFLIKTSVYMGFSIQPCLITKGYPAQKCQSGSVSLRFLFKHLRRRINQGSRTAFSPLPTS